MKVRWVDLFDAAMGEIFFLLNLSNDIAPTRIEEK